jgi:hypothetical protein
MKWKSLVSTKYPHLLYNNKCVSSALFTVEKSVFFILLIAPKYKYV